MALRHHNPHRYLLFKLTYYIRWIQLKVPKGFDWGAPSSYPVRNHPDVSSSRPTAREWSRAMKPRPGLPRAVQWA